MFGSLNFFANRKGKFEQKIFPFFFTYNIIKKTVGKLGVFLMDYRKLL